jgi:hypothetical protein
VLHRMWARRTTPIPPRHIALHGAKPLCRGGCRRGDAASRHSRRRRDPCRAPPRFPRVTQRRIRATRGFAARRVTPVGNGMRGIRTMGARWSRRPSKTRATGLHGGAVTRWKRPNGAPSTRAWARGAAGELGKHETTEGTPCRDVSTGSTPARPCPRQSGRGPALSVWPSRRQADLRPAQSL